MDPLKASAVSWLRKVNYGNELATHLSIDFGDHKWTQQMKVSIRRLPVELAATFKFKL